MRTLNVTHRVWSYVDKKARADAGYATIAAAGIIVAVVSVLLIVVALTRIIISSHQAQVAADMGAIAGAWELAMGKDGCAQAQRIVEINGGQLLRCHVIGHDVQVHVGLGRSEVRAQAGPL
ncbi:MAG: Rv3654c family TadE-like protein [Corynebacterium sp.]|nr:Rv3654c family TadE-like protein [Corynebacterium sp.]